METFPRTLVSSRYREMQKYVLGLIGLMVLSLSGFAQTPPSTRPRVAPTPAQQAPTIKNDVPSSPVDRRPPVLNNGTLPRSQPAATPTPEGTVSGDSEVIKVDTDLVTLPVSVLDREGRFVSGLQAKDFQIFENGIQQKVG